MQKLLAALLCLSAITVFADNVVTCDGDALDQVNANRVKIKDAFVKGDGCSAGKLQVANHKVIQANLACFPNSKKGDWNLFHVFDDIDAQALKNTDKSCDKVHDKIMNDHQKIKLSLTKGDGCSAGKLQSADHKVIKQNLACFPQYESDLFFVTNAAAKYDTKADHND